MFFVFDMEVYICWLQIKSIYGFKKKKSLYTMASTDKFGVILDQIRKKKKKVTRKEENFNFVFQLGVVDDNEYQRR